MYLNVLNLIPHGLLSFEKCCMKKVRFYHRVGLDSRIFRTKHFEQKYVLTGFIIILLQWRLCPFNTKISFEISLYFVHFLRILHVYDFLSMFYLTEQLENAYLKSLDSMQKLNYIYYFFFKVSI